MGRSVGKNGNKNIKFGFWAFSSLCEWVLHKLSDLFSYIHTEVSVSGDRRSCCQILWFLTKQASLRPEVRRRLWGMWPFEAASCPGSPGSWGSAWWPAGMGDVPQSSACLRAPCHLVQEETPNTQCISGHCLKVNLWSYSEIATWETGWQSGVGCALRFRQIQSFQSSSGVPPPPSPLPGSVPNFWH